MRNMLAVWREHGVDEAMRSAWERGIVLAGLSAGAMCWFEGGITMSGGAPRPAAGLGLLAGSLSVHLDGEPERLPVYREAVAAGSDAAGLRGRRLRGAAGVRHRVGEVRELAPGRAGAARARPTARAAPWSVR